MANGAFDAGSFYVDSLQKLGNDRIFNAAKKQSPLLDSGAVKKVGTKGKEVVINLKDQGAVVQATLDMGAVSYGQQQKLQKTVDPVTLIVGIQLGVNAVEQTESKSEAIDALADEIENAASTAGQETDALMVGRELATVQAIAAIGASAVLINEFGALSPGRNYDHLDSSGDYVQSFTVTAVAHAADADGPHTLTVDPVLTVATAVGDQIVVAGTVTNVASSSNLRFTSLSQACGGANMYGLTNAEVSRYQFEGRAKASTGLFDKAELNALEAERRNLSRCELGFSLCNSLIEEEYTASFFDAGAHYMPGGSPDMRKHSSVRYKNKPVIVDENCNDDWYLVGKDSFELAESMSWRVTGLGSTSRPASMAAFKDKATHSYKLTVHGLYENRFKRPNAIAALTGIQYS